MDSNSNVTPVEELRKANRYAIITERKKMRDERNDRHRCSLKNFQFDSKPASVNIEELASKLKSKSTLSVVDLKQLKNVLLEDEKNIQIVLRKEGVLRGLVREISGSHWERQVEAAACLCNLALGDQRACNTIMKSAGAYLVALMDSQNLELAECCAWTVGNLCGSGVEVSRRVNAAGGVARLCARCALGPRPAAAAVYALTLYTHAMKNELSKDQVELIVSSVGGMAHCPTDFRLHYNLTCHEDFSDPLLLIQDQIIKHFPGLMHQHRTCAGQESCSLLFAIRALANMEGHFLYPKFLASLVANEDPQLVHEFFSLVQDKHLRTSMLWLLGNMQHLQGLREIVVGEMAPSKVAGSSSHPS